MASKDAVVTAAGVTDIEVAMSTSKLGALAGEVPPWSESPSSVVLESMQQPRCSQEGCWPGRGV
jgi:hypothetical protein